MKKAKLLVLILALIGMLIFLIPNACLADETAKVKVIEGKSETINQEYDDIQTALDAQTDTNEVELQLQGDITNGKGFKVPENKTVTIDFNSYTYTVDTSLVGSSGYETNACQLLKDATVTLKNGTADILIQNYSNLTIENMTLNHTKAKGEEGYPIALSVNNGTVTVNGTTSISSKNIALDVYYWKERYEAGPDVTVNISGKVSGDIFVRSSDEEAQPNNRLTITNIEHTSGNFQVSEKSKGNVTISGGKFSQDVTEFADEGYTCVSRNGKYLVGLKATAINSAETLELTVGDSANLNVSIVPPETVETLSYEWDNRAAIDIASNGIVTAKAEGTVNITIKVGDINKNCVVTVKAKEPDPEDQTGIVTPEVVPSEDTFSFGVAVKDKSEVSRVLRETMRDPSNSLYEQIQSYLQTGAVVTSEVQVSEITETEIPVDTLNGLLTTAKLDEIVKFIDISVAVSSNGQSLGNLTKLSEKIPITINIPTELRKENRTFYVLKYHDGNVEKLALTQNENSYSFYTDEFSVFALAYEDGIDENPNGTTDTPKTGDTLANMFAILVILTAVALIIIRITKKNRLMK